MLGTYSSQILIETHAQINTFPSAHKFTHTHTHVHTNILANTHLYILDESNHTLSLTLHSLIHIKSLQFHALPKEIRAPIDKIMRRVAGLTFKESQGRRSPASNVSSKSH